VQELLRHGEDIHQHRHTGRDATVFDALATFEDLVHVAKVLDAIVLKNSGKPTEAPIGIVTVAAVPGLNGMVTAGRVGRPVGSSRS
jgi:hypothetical protein